MADKKPTPANAAPADSDDDNPTVAAPTPGPRPGPGPAPAPAPAANQPTTAAPRAAQGRPSQATLAAQPDRTHRTWTPKYGRVQKCDWCNGRADGVLMVCTGQSGCALRMCQDCARNRIWHSNRGHFIDPDALDWTVRNAPRAKQKPRAPKALKVAKAAKKAPAKRPAPASPGDEPAGPTARRPRLARDDSGPAANGQLADNSASLAHSGHAGAHFPAPTYAPTHANHGADRPSTIGGHYSYRQEAPRYHQEPLPYHPAADHSGYYAPPPPAMPTPRPLSRAHQPAARSTFGMGEMSRRRADADADVNAEEEGRSKYIDKGEENVVYKKKGLTNKVNEPRHRHGNHSAEHPAAYHPGPRTYTGHGFVPSPLAALAAPAPLLARSSLLPRSPVVAPSPLAAPSRLAAWDPQPSPELRPLVVPGSSEQDGLVRDIYQWLYSYWPFPDPRQPRTEIPGSWKGRSQYPHGEGQHPAAHHQGRAHGQYQAGDQQHPVSAGHPRHDNQQQQHHHPHDPSFHPPPSSGHHHHHDRHDHHDQPPTHNPYAEQLAAEAAAHHRQHHDAQLLRDMARTWAGHPDLRALQTARRPLEALAALWAVYALRRAELQLPPPPPLFASGPDPTATSASASASASAHSADRAVRWFVGLRDLHVRQGWERERERERQQQEQRARWEAPVGGLVPAVVEMGAEGGQDGEDGDDGGGNATIDACETEER